jgi:hypothetical protein
MTAAVHRMGTPSLSIPPSQNTAPVLEFNCLYTHDIRRKQKRWQDGFLRFHTFNKRVMVYDVPRNFIGDMHWKEGEDLQEGDEVTLEKDAVLVQVAENVGRTETDLTELKQSAKKSKRVEGGQRLSSPPRNAVTPSRPMGPPAARLSTTSVAGGSTQLKHRSLNALLGTPKGRLGKATVPTKSPYELRQAEENEGWESGRPPKRLKAEPLDFVRTTVASTDTRKDTPLWKRTSEARAKAAKRITLPPDQQMLGTKEIIDLSDDCENSPSRFLPRFSSDTIGPASSPVREVPRPPSPPARKRQVRSSSPAFQTHNTTKTKRKEKTEGCHTPPRPEKVARVEPPREVAKKPEHVHSPPPIAPHFLLSSSNKPSQILRMATSAPKRKTLTYLDQISGSLRGTVEGTTSANARSPASSIRKTQRELLEERLAKMNKMAQQRADDWKAIVDDANATAQEITRMDEAARSPKSNETPVIPRQAEPLPEGPTKLDRPFRRVLLERDTAASATASTNRIPGAPVRVTPSPTVRAARLAEQSKSKPSNAALVQSKQQLAQRWTASPPTKPVPVTASIPLQEQCDTPLERNSTAQSADMPPPPAPQRRLGIGRKETRKSAQACFPTALNVVSNGTSTVMLAKPFQAPKPHAQPKPSAASEEVGPWTHEAFDLFTWRPPGWDEEKWCVPKGDDNTAS